MNLVKTPASFSVDKKSRAPHSKPTLHSIKQKYPGLSGQKIRASHAFAALHPDNVQIMHLCNLSGLLNFPTKKFKSKEPLSHSNLYII